MFSIGVAFVFIKVVSGSSEDISIVLSKYFELNLLRLNILFLGKKFDMRYFSKLNL